MSLRKVIPYGQLSYPKKIVKMHFQTLIAGK
jgi:hypothetical protein